MSTEKSSMELSKLETRKSKAERDEAGPSRQSSVRGIKSSSLCKDQFTDDPVPVPLPSYPEVIPFEDDKNSSPLSEMVSPSCSCKQPTSHAYPQPRHDSNDTESQALKATSERSSRPTRYPWHLTRLALRGSTITLFHITFIVKDTDYFGYWETLIYNGYRSDPWTMVLITLVPIALLWHTVELMAVGVNGRGIHLWVQIPLDSVFACSTIGCALWIIQAGGMGLKSALVALFAGLCHVILFTFGIASLTKKTKAGYIV